MKKATAKDLRQRTAALLDDVRKGQEILITYRGKSVALLVPAEAIQAKPINPVGFGLWRDRKEMQKVDKWLRELRAPRFRR